MRREKDGLPCFQKSFPLRSLGTGLDKTEIAISLALNHPNVINTVQAVLHPKEGVKFPQWDSFDEGSVDDGPRSSVYTELCELGQIDHFVSGQVIPEAFFWHTFESLAMGIAYAHDEGITTFRDHYPFSGRTNGQDSVAHNDLAPRNIFLKLPDPGHEYPRVIIADWGLANTFVQTREVMMRWRHTAADAMKTFDDSKQQDLKAILIMVEQLAMDWGPRPLDKYSGGEMSCEWGALLDKCWKRIEESGTFTASLFLQEIREAKVQAKIENEPIPAGLIDSKLSKYHRQFVEEAHDSEI